MFENIFRRKEPASQLPAEQLYNGQTLEKMQSALVDVVGGMMRDRYEISMQINDPEIERIMGDSSIMKTRGRLLSSAQIEDDWFSNVAAALTLEEHDDYIKNPKLFIIFRDHFEAAAKSSYPKYFSGMIFASDSPSDPDSYRYYKDSSVTLPQALRTVFDAAGRMPKPEDVTTVRGFKMTPLIVDGETTEAPDVPQVTYFGPEQPKGP